MDLSAKIIDSDNITHASWSSSKQPIKITQNLENGMHRMIQNIQKTL